jgi:hypothetical protein
MTRRRPAGMRGETARFAAHRASATDAPLVVKTMVTLVTSARAIRRITSCWPVSRQRAPAEGYSAGSRPGPAAAIPMAAAAIHDGPRR